MKQKILLVLFIALSTMAFSQKGVKVYGFYRDVLPGTVPRGTDENGKKLSGPDNTVEYLIYISGNSGTRIYPAEVWIKGTRYAAAYENIKSPVVIKNNLGKDVTLVPKTTAKVLKVRPGTWTSGKNFPNAKSKAASNDVVVVYKLNGKFYSALVKHLTRLEPQSHE